MPGRRRVFILLLALFLAGGAVAAELGAEPGAVAPTDTPTNLPAAAPEPSPPLPAADSSRDERSLLRILHFEFGLVSACGLADDEARAGYEVAAGRLERRLGIDADAEARFREINRGWTEANARWAAGNGAGFKERCQAEAFTDRDRFKAVFRETGQTLGGAPTPSQRIALLAGAVLLFVLSHLGLAMPAVRGRIVRGLGEWGYLALYSVIALAAFAWMLAAFAAAPDAWLWRPPTALRHLALTLVFLAVLFVVAGYTKANPTAVMLDRLPGDPCRGITRVTRHPVLWGIALWAVAHVLANGRAAALVLFLGMAVLALAGAALIDRRRRLAGGKAWRQLEASTSNVPFAAMREGRAGAGVKRVLGEIGWWRLVLGVVIYGLLLALHPWFAGVPAFRI